MHRLLKGQIKKFLNQEDIERLSGFLDAIGDVYQNQESDLADFEQKLEKSSLDLFNANEKLLSLNANIEKKRNGITEQIDPEEREYQHLVESANVIIYKTNLNGDFIYINPKGEFTSGYSSSELIGTNFSNIVAVEHKEKMVIFYRDQLVNRTESTYLEYEIITKSGERVWLGQNVQLIIRDDKPTGFLIVARNITERVHSDNKIKQSEERYKKMFEGAFDGVIRLNAQGHFLEWNSKMESMLGYSDEELFEMSISNIIHPDDMEKSLRYQIKLLEDGFYSHYTGRFISKHGTIVHIEINSTATYEAGKFSGSIDNIRDISERVAIEKAIIKSEEKYRGIIENLELGLLEVDANEVITKVYPSFNKLTGYSQEDLVGKNPTNFLLHPDSEKEMKKQTGRRVHGESSVYEVQIRKKSGEYKWVIISGAPYYDDQGGYRGSLGVHLDISRQKKLESDLKKANKIAQASSKAKELFLANMSHEIRTPLNAVIGLSNLLKRTDLDNDQSEYAINIFNSSKNLLLLVNDILDMSKIDSGKIEMNSAEFNLRKTLGTIMSSATYLAEKKRLSLDLKIDETLDDLYLGDELKICQVLINLVNNAIKFTASGGVIIHIKHKTDEPDEHGIEIHVEDTGKGIAKEALGVIFEDFSQEDNTISKNYGGTGLGLSISKKLVNLLGGSLSVTSELGVGTTFYFNVTLQRVDRDNQPKDNTEKMIVDWGKINILTVEDNPVNQFVIESTIKSWNGSTDIANNGKEAISMLSEQQYDVILMDMQMPVMDGIAATKFIRQEMKLDIPIIAFTANAMKKEMDRCLEVGMDDYIAKPFQEEALKSKILNLVLKGHGKEALLLHEENIKKTESEPFFTTQRLEDLSRGNKEFVERMLTIFCEDGEIQMKQMHISTDPDEISALAHKIKPSIDYLSNEDMKQLVRKIEKKEFIENSELLDSFKTKLEDLILKANQFINK